MRTLSKIQLSLLVLILTVAIPVVSYAVDGKIKIGQTPSTTFPIVINESGSYVLTSNLQVSTNFNCIQISADNVSLDLNGFALTGPGTGSSGSGIYVNGYNNITVMNGTVKDFMSSGIYFLSSTKIQLKDLKCSNNGQRGIYVEHATVVNCIAEDNGTDGIRAYYSTVRDCTSNNNTDDGLAVLSSTVLNFQAYSNDNRGIYSRRSSLTNCTITFSGDRGIEAVDSSITGCTIHSNNHYGIEVTNSTSTNCTLYSNYYGIWSVDSTIINCSIIQNRGGGISATNTTLTNCTVNNNEGTGITVTGSTITNCTVNNNWSDGIVAINNSRIEGNNVRSNGQEQSNGNGIYLYSTIDGRMNYVIKNTASENYSGGFFDHGSNNHMPLTGDNANYDFGS